MWVTCNRKCWQEQSTGSRFSGIPHVLCYAAAAAAAAAAHAAIVVIEDPGVFVAILNKQ
jgi:hypothetical protein